MVPALKSLADEISANDPLIKGTYENALTGVVMPNIAQIGRFWSSLKAALEIATSGRATPEAALQSAGKNMKSKCEEGFPIRQVLARQPQPSRRLPVSLTERFHRPLAQRTLSPRLSSGEPKFHLPDLTADVMVPETAHRGIRSSNDDHRRDIRQ